LNGKQQKGSHGWCGCPFAVFYWLERTGRATIPETAQQSGRPEPLLWAVEASILTAQQIASLDLSGVDWAVLSACNTGNGELHDGEGVLGLERAFRVAGARSVVVTLWPVDDDVTRRFMHELYAQRLGRHASAADAVWNSAHMLLLERRAAGKSTHPWSWAGFVGSGGWE
jgi:CHAT domain-containing protein